MDAQNAASPYSIKGTLEVDENIIEVVLMLHMPLTDNFEVICLLRGAASGAVSRLFLINCFSYSTAEADNFDHRGNKN